MKKEITNKEKNLLLLAGFSAPIFAYGICYIFKEYNDIKEQIKILKNGANIAFIFVIISFILYFIYFMIDVAIEFGFINFI